MNFSEKLFTLRKAKNLTQEQLAEQLDVSRQSISKWESGQSTPDLEKIAALSAVLDVTTDYLLKPSEINDLSVKTEMLEKQQQQIFIREEKRQRVLQAGLYSLAVYLLFFAVYTIADYCLDFYFYSVFYAGFLIATAIVIFICVKKLGKNRLE